MKNSASTIDPIGDRILVLRGGANFQGTKTMVPGLSPRAPALGSTLANAFGVNLQTELLPVDDTNWLVAVRCFEDYGAAIFCDGPLGAGYFHCALRYVWPISNFSVLVRESGFGRHG